MKRHISVATAAFFLSILLFPLTTRGQGQLKPKEIYKKYSSAVVLVYQFEKDRLGKNTGIKLGSGSIIHSSGIIITNQHVIGDAKEVNILLKEKKKVLYDHVSVYLRKNHKRALTAKVIRSHPRRDLALLKIQSKKKDFPTIPLGNSEEIEIGETTIVIGHPKGCLWSMSTGVVSSVRPDAIQTDAAINTGNSGGPLLNLQGEMIGVNTYILRNSQNLGFARPTRLVYELGKGLISPPKSSKRASQNPLKTFQDIKKHVSELYVTSLYGGDSQKHQKKLLQCFHPQLLEKDKVTAKELMSSLKPFVLNPTNVHLKKGETPLLTLHYMKMAGTRTKPVFEWKVLVMSFQKVKEKWKVDGLCTEKNKWARTVALGHKLEATRGMALLDLQKGESEEVAKKEEKPSEKKGEEKKPEEKKEEERQKAAREKMERPYRQSFAKLQHVVRSGREENFFEVCDIEEFCSESDTLLMAAGKRGQLIRLPLGSQKKEVLVPGGWVKIGGWSSTGHYIYVTSLHSGRLYKIDSATGKDIVVSQEGWANVTHLVARPKKVYGIDEKAGVLFSHHLETGKTEVLSRGFKAVGLMVGGKSNLYIFSSKTGKIYSYNLKTGEESTLASKGWNAIRKGAFWQGKIYVVSSHSGRIYEIDPQSGKDQSISKGWKETTAIATSSSGLYLALKSGEIHRLNPLTKKTERMATGYRHLRRFVVLSPEITGRHHLSRTLYPYLRWQYKKGIRNIKIKTYKRKKNLTLGRVSYQFQVNHQKWGQVHIWWKIQKDRVLLSGVIVAEGLPAEIDLYTLLQKKGKNWDRGTWEYPYPQRHKSFRLRYWGFREGFPSPDLKESGN